MIRLDLQEYGDAFGKIVIDFASGSVLVADTVEKLAAVTAVTHFADNETGAPLAPEHSRTGCEDRSRGIQLQLGVCQLKLNSLSVALIYG